MVEEKVIALFVSGCASLVALGMFLFVNANRRINELKGDTKASLDKKADIDACLAQHRNDDRLYDRLDIMNLALTEAIKAISRIDERTVILIEKMK